MQTFSDLSGEEKRALLSLARWTIGRELGVTVPKDFFCTFASFVKGHPLLRQKTGAFVTLRKAGDLRGCIGNMLGHSALHETIASMAVSSAFRDPRFSPLAKEEFQEISIEISVLSPLARIDSLQELEPGIHGLYITKGYCSGVLLPQVATEQGWQREEFALNTCRKAGLPPDALEDPETRLEIFSAQIFSEEDFKT
jgi:AmmeMemoRadiSam system protein A